MRIFASGDLLELIIFAVIAGGMFVFQKFSKHKDTEAEDAERERSHLPRWEGEDEGAYEDYNPGEIPWDEEFKKRRESARGRAKSPRRNEAPAQVFDYASEIARNERVAAEAAEKLRIIQAAQKKKSAAQKKGSGAAPIMADEIGSAFEIRSSLGEFLDDPQSMRKAVVLSEILDRPVSVRGRQRPL